MDFSYTLLTGYNHTGHDFSTVNRIHDTYILGSYILLVFTIFPCYINVYQKNTEQDKRTVVFPIIDHLFKTVIASYFFVVVAYCCGKIYLKLIDDRSGAIGFIFGLSFFVAFAIIAILCEVNQILLSILSIQRFILYFLPGYEKFIDFSEKTMKNLIWCLYALLNFEGAIILYGTFFDKAQTALRIYVVCTKKKELSLFPAENLLVSEFLRFLKCVGTCICYTIHSDHV